MIGPILAALGAFALSKYGSDQRAARDVTMKQNDAIVQAMISQATKIASEHGENPLDTPEARGAIKKLGGDPNMVDMLSTFAQGQRNTPEVQARRQLRSQVSTPVPQTDQEMSQEVPPGPHEPNTMDIASRMAGLTGAQRAFAFPSYGAAEKEAATTARDTAHANMFESAARSNDAGAILPAAQARHLEMQTAEGPKQTQIALQQAQNQATALQAARREAEIAHADRIADTNVRLGQVRNDTERIKMERVRDDLMEQHRKNIEKITQQQTDNQTAQLGLTVTQHLLDKQVPAGPAALASKQILEIMQGGPRKRLDPELESLTGVSTGAATRLGQLNTQLQKSQEDIRGLASSIPVSLKKGEITADSVALVMRKHNEALVDTLHVQAEEAKRGIIPFNPISNPQQYAFENMLVPDDKGNPMTPAAYTEKYKTSVIGNAAVPPRYQTLPMGPDEEKTANPQETTYKGILGRITGAPGTAPETKAVPPTTVPDIPPSQFMEQDRAAGAAEKAKGTAAADARKQMYKDLADYNATAESGLRVPQHQARAYIKLRSTDGLTHNQAINTLLKGH